jgi:outer membrane protein OmpA-like peptidoglycan-associated protein
LGLDIDGAPANVFPEDHNRGSESVSAADLLTRSSAPASAEAAEPVTPAKPEKPRQPDIAAVKPPKPAKPAPEKPVAEAPKPESESEAAKPAAADTANATQTPEHPPAEDTSMPPIAQPSTTRASELDRTEGSATPRQLTAPANDTLSAPKTLTSGELVGRITFPAFNSTPPLVVKDMIRDKILPTLRMNPTLRVQVSGFADWTPNGSIDASTAISQRRAENITRFLIEEGIEPSRLQTRGVGVDFLPGAARNRVDITAIEP